MAGDIENGLIKAASVVITYDSTKTNKIEFLLPNNKVSSNVLNMIRALKQYRKLENTCFNRIDMHKCHIERWHKKIVFQLDAKRMQNLNSEWECAIAGDLKKNHLFHSLEKVIINRKSKDKKLHKNEKVSKVQNENCGKNISSIDSIDKFFDAWDIECKNMQNELKERESEKCILVDESFGILVEIEDMSIKLEEYLNHIQLNKFNLKQMELEQIEKNDVIDTILKQEIQSVKHKMGLIQKNLIKQEIEMKERKDINQKIKRVVEMDIAKTNKLLQTKADLTNDMLIIEIKLCEVNKRFRINTIMYDSCYEFGEINDRIQIGSNVESSVNFPKQQSKQKENNNYNETVQGYELDNDRYNIDAANDITSLISTNLNSNHSILVKFNSIPTSVPSVSNISSVIIGVDTFENDATSVLNISGINFCNDSSCSSLMKTSIEDKLRVVLNYLVCILDSKLNRNIKICMQGWYGRSVVFDDSG